jgi:N-acetyl-gamma-glutamyl-phosphate reductase
MKKLRVGIVGASGYSGSVAARLVVAHERLALAFATSDKLAGESVALQLGLTGVDRATAGGPSGMPGDSGSQGGRGRPNEGPLLFVPNAAALEHADQCDAVVLATAADVSMRLVPAFAERGKQVLDLSGAFRLDAQSYPRWYGFEHSAPTWLNRAHYGLPELFGPPPPGAIVANPGCYPTAALLALAPLLRERLVEPRGIVVDAKSGVTGAGKQSGEAYSFVEVDDDVHAYRLLAHQHTPEIARGLARSKPSATSTVPAAAEVTVTFTAHLLPIRRGLIATCYARPCVGASAKRVAECLAEAYPHSAFVRAVAPDQVGLKGVVGTNFALIGATADADTVIAIGAIDNLLKGAAGQLIQNLNVMNGWHEATGLDHLQRVSP